MDRDLALMVLYEWNDRKREEGLKEDFNEYVKRMYPKTYKLIVGQLRACEGVYDERV